VDLLIHATLGNVVLAVAVMLLVAVLVKGRVMSTWVAAVGGVWGFSSFPGIEWWEVLGGETMNFLAHSSFSNIFLMVLMGLFMMVLMFILMSMFLLSKTVGSIR
jgi:hypothetical protein